MKKSHVDLDVAAASAELTVIPSGKVVDFITKRLLKDTPEEYVRQNVAMSLVLEYGYEREQVEVEFRIKVGSGSKRVDLAIFPEGVPHTQEHVSVIVETKKQGTKREDKADGVGQLKSYMSACLNAEHGMWTNGDDRACYVKGSDQAKQIFLDAIDIPARGNKKAEAPTREILRPATGDNLLFAFRRCHNYIAGNQGLQKPEAFWELLKVIFCKIEDERSGTETLQFYVSQNERASMSLQGRVKSRLEKLFAEQVVKRYPTIFKQTERLEMIPAVLAYVVAELQQYSLLDSPVDVKGVAYEEVVGSNLRGDRGEFFTPRNACRMAVRMLDPGLGERLLDPACGTGGFLITAMNHVLEKIEASHRRRWRGGKPTPSQSEEYYRQRLEYLKENVFGLDLNPLLVASWIEKNSDGERIEPAIRRNTDGTAVLQSSQAPEVLFVERALQFLKPGGRMAIVLPNGLLNNPGLSYFRAAVLEKAQLLAVIDMHRDLFQPHNDTQTSLVLLRKWRQGETARNHGDYPVFMAVAESIGHDKRGKTTYKRSADGSVVLEEVKTTSKRVGRDGREETFTVRLQKPIVDDELDSVSEAYLGWLLAMTSPSRQRNKA